MAMRYHRKLHFYLMRQEGDEDFQNFRSQYLPSFLVGSLPFLWVSCARECEV